MQSDVVPMGLNSLRCASESRPKDGRIDPKVYMLQILWERGFIDPNVPCETDLWKNNKEDGKKDNVGRTI